MSIYIVQNPDWTHEYGFTKNPVNRLHSYHSYSSYMHTFLYLCDIRELPTYNLDLVEYDQIFSKIGRNDQWIEIIEQSLVSFNVRHLNDYQRIVFTCNRLVTCKKLDPKY